MYVLPLFGNVLKEGQPLAPARTGQEKNILRSLPFVAIALVTFPFTARATETIAYSYDARGRLVQVARSGSVNQGVVTSYNFDNADNRLNVTVAGAGSAPAPPPTTDPGPPTSTTRCVATVWLGGTFHLIPCTRRT